MSKFIQSNEILYGDQTSPRTPIPEELNVLLPEIFQAVKDFGCDYFPSIVEMLKYDEMSEIAAYGGFPSRYPHWKWGMEYEAIQKRYTYGGGKIFELVINSVPCYIYCMSSNTLLDNVTVVAHALGHSCFFKNNIFFEKTSKNMINTMANHGSRIRQYMARWGRNKVTEFLDDVLRIETLIDPAKAWEKRKISNLQLKDKREYKHPNRLKYREDHEYMDEYINPSNWINKQKTNIERYEAANQIGAFFKPTKDIMGFLKDNAPLETWQSDIMSMLHEEALYFAPQRATKTINEGYACVHKDTLMCTNKGILTAEEIVDKNLEVEIFDGKEKQNIVNWFKFDDRKRFKVITKKGYVLIGSDNHRILDSNGNWVELKDVSRGLKINLIDSGSLWNNRTQKIKWQSGDKKFISVTNDVAELIGFMLGSGRLIKKTKDIILKSKDKNVINKCVKTIKDDFGLEVSKNSGDTWKATIDSPKLTELIGLSYLKERVVPTEILKSPKSVVSAFLSSYFDSKGRACQDRIVLIDSSEKLIRQIQSILLNYKIFSTVNPKDKSNYCLGIFGESLKRFYREIGFNNKEKQIILCKSIFNHPWFCEEDTKDSVLSVEEIESGEVYDFSVENSHKYSAQGFTNHNSWVDYNIIAKQGYASLGQEYDSSGIIDYAKHKMMVLGGKYSLNPYKVGFDILSDIEDRWNKGKFGTEWNECDNLKQRQDWDKQLGLGKEKVFEVRKFYDDVTVIMEYLTPEIIEKNELFLWKKYPNGDYVIESKDPKVIRKSMIEKHINGGLPEINLVDYNHRNNNILLLEHTYDGTPLNDKYTRPVLQSIRKMWKKDVYLLTRNRDHEFMYKCEGTKGHITVVEQSDYVEDNYN